MSLPNLFSSLITSGQGSFAIWQGTSGTAPTADSAADTVNLTSSDSSLGIAGNSGTDVLDFTVTDAVKNYGQNLEITLTGQTFLPGVTTSIGFALNRTDYTAGSIMLYITTSLSDQIKRSTFNSIFTNSVDASESQSTQRYTEVTPFSASYYSFTVWRHVGYKRTPDTILWLDSQSGGGQVRLLSVHINGGTLVINFFTFSALNASMNLQGYARLWRSGA